MVIRSAEGVDVLHIPPAVRSARGINITATRGGIVGLAYHLRHIMGLDQRYLYAESRSERYQLPSMPDGLGISEIIREARERSTYTLQRRTSRGSALFARRKVGGVVHLHPATPNVTALAGFA